MKTLLEMLRYKRPAYSKTDDHFCERYLLPLGAKRDGVGNLSVTIGDTPRVSFSSHTDTVHRSEGRQKLSVSKSGVVSAKRSECLGADDTAGVWIMREMILREIPGLYLFHRAEEVGCKGSRFIATQTPEILSDIDISVAFDRRGETSVVTHQCGLQCASPQFAESLCESLGMSHSPDDSGMFTDNENYTELVSEIVNVSVGYAGAHSPGESLRTPYLFTLLEAVCGVEWETLPVVRDPLHQAISGYHFETLSERSGAERFESLVRDNPDVAVLLLEAYGVDETDFLDELYAECEILPSEWWRE